VACRVCPECGRPKDCMDELCIVCELKGAAVDKVKSVVKKIKRGGKDEKGT